MSTKQKVNGKTVHNKNTFPVVVIGGSAGGYNALLTVVSSEGFNPAAAVLVVLHLSQNSDVGFLIQHLQRHTDFKCRLPSHGEEVKAGHIYFAMSGMHMMCENNHIIYGTGPNANAFRPSIDVL